MSGDQRPGVGEPDAEMRDVRRGVVDSGVAARNTMPLKVVQRLEDMVVFPVWRGPVTATSRMGPSSVRRSTRRATWGRQKRRRGFTG